MSLKLSFRYESFSDSGTSGTSADAAAVGLIFSDTSASDIPDYYGTISVTSTTATNTTYSWTPPLIDGSVADVLVVAGGGGGGYGGGNLFADLALGGGGAGGLILDISSAIGSTSHTIIVGAGGSVSTNGQDSEFGTTLVAIGGGVGGRDPGADGGSGGGGGAYRPNGSYNRVNSGGESLSITPYIGNDGGDAARNSTFELFGGAGGGAGSIGGNADSSGNGSAGDGGSGYLALGTYYAGGGGGGCSRNDRNGTGGLGGGGNGLILDGTDGLGGDGSGTDGLGGGGGGGNNSYSGGTGGSGIVVLQFSPPPIPLRSPSTISGLNGWFTGFSAEMDASNELTRWRDLSGNGNHVESSEIRSGSINLSTSATNQNLYNSLSTANAKLGVTPFPFLYGSTDAGFKFPTTMLNSNENYTLFHVARYYKPGGEVPVRKRIFDDVKSTFSYWWSGFDNGKSGVAFHNKWLTEITDLHGDNWVLSTDQKNMYRSNGIDRTESGISGGLSAQIGINYSNQSVSYSDWACAEVIIYDRELTSAEYEAVEAYLNAKYFSTNLEIPSTGPISIMSFATYLYDGTGYPISLQSLAANFGLTSSIGFSNFRGKALIPRVSPVLVTSSDLPTQVFTIRGPSFTSSPSIKFVGADGTEYNVSSTTYVSQGVATFTLGTLSSTQLANQPFKIKVNSATSIDTIDLVG